MGLGSLADEIVAPFSRRLPSAAFETFHSSVTSAVRWRALPHPGPPLLGRAWGLYAFDNQLLAQILSSPHLANLRTLVLHHDRNGNTADEHVIVEAMHSPHRTNLEHLAVNVDGTWRGPSRNVLNAVTPRPHTCGDCGA